MGWCFCHLPSDHSWVQSGGAADEKTVRLSRDLETVFPSGVGTQKRPNSSNCRHHCQQHCVHFQAPAGAFCQARLRVERSFTMWASMSSSLPLRALTGNRSSRHTLRWIVDGLAEIRMDAKWLLSAFSMEGFSPLAIMCSPRAIERATSRTQTDGLIGNGVWSFAFHFEPTETGKSWPRYAHSERS